jgi:hypothetical protein
LAFKFKRSYIKLHFFVKFNSLTFTYLKNTGFFVALKLKLLNQKPRIK